MSRLPLTIAKHPPLAPAEDFHRLRREGIGFIEQTASRLWSDYNESDPGITILEALCYAITDLGYRTGWDIADLLAPQTPSPDQSDPFPNQPFFTPREILTVNPLTPDDFRRLLIDLETVRNAWMVCKECACDAWYYAWCEEEELELSYRLPGGARRKPVEVWPLGLYEALLELEADPDTGDLNDRKIETGATLSDAGGSHPLTVELRFQEGSLSDRERWSLFLLSDDAFAEQNGQSYHLRLTRLGATRSYDVQSDPLLDDDGRNSYLRRHWRDVFYLTFEIELLPSGEKILLEHAALKLLGTAGSREAVTLQALKALLEQRGANGPIQRYRKKELLKAAAVAQAKKALFSHRNLDEDFCRVKVIEIEEVAVCADVEVAPEADIELVQARIWFETERYLNPPLPFHTLQEMLDEGVPVEEIFNGPKLTGGFIKDADLQAASLKSVLCVSDLINRLMEIEGVIAVNHLQLTRYDGEGKVVKGAADPTWSSEGKPVFDPARSSASWLLYLGKQHQPRLYGNASRFLFYKNGLPFHPRMDEAMDTLTQLRGEAERTRIRNAANDIPIPAGTYRHPDRYFPVQYSFPLTYGIGPDHLSTTAPARRRAQARELKAYLMVFEQILANAFAQLAHAAELFSLDPAVDRTYFVTELTGEIIQGYDELVSGLGKAELEALAETEPEFLLRRNRFLDHLLARFGEQYGEYTLLLVKRLGQQPALDRLIDDKIAFLSAYPVISHDRGRAFNYLVDPCNPDNQPGIKKKIALLLGDPDLEGMIVVEHLLLRPKFPGDALYPACSDGACATCGEEDPYSFRLSLIMPGWSGAFNTDLEMRSFADRSIRQEIPSHLVVKICWVGNAGFVEEPCDPVVTELARLIEEKGVTAGGVHPTRPQACACAGTLYSKFSEVFREWYQDKFLQHIHGDALKMELELAFGSGVNPAAIPCEALLDPLWLRITALMVEHFRQVALHGWQFERFEAAWCDWLAANAGFDWTEERLQERVEAILSRDLTSVSDTQTPESLQLCRCAGAILSGYGSEFYQWMDGLFRSGSFDPDAPLPAFPVELPPHCSGLGFRQGTIERIRELLEGRYLAYREVSYRLRVVADLLSRLSNSYPPATLHDCDEGNDTNPVRLGTTALGS